MKSHAGKIHFSLQGHGVQTPRCWQYRLIAVSQRQPTELTRFTQGSVAYLGTWLEVQSSGGFITATLDELGTCPQNLMLLTCYSGNFATGSRLHQH